MRKYLQAIVISKCLYLNTYKLISKKKNPTHHKYYEFYIR